jgi:hypothetical protein
MADNATRFIELTVSIVSAYVSNNSVPSGELPALIGQVHTALTRVSGAHSERLGDGHKPAITAKRSITPDYLPGGRQKIQISQATSAHTLQSHPAAISGEMGPQQRLSHGGPELCRCPLAPRQTNGSGAATAAPQVAARRIEHFVFGHVLSQTGSRPGSA